MDTLRVGRRSEATRPASYAAERRLRHFHSDGEMVARAACPFRLLDPRLLQSYAVQPEREDVIHPLAGEFRLERADGIRRGAVHFAERVDVARVEHFLDRAAREPAAVLGPFLLRARLALRGVDLLVRGVGVEVAAEQVGCAGLPVRGEGV